MATWNLGELISLEAATANMAIKMRLEFFHPTSVRKVIVFHQHVRISEIFRYTKWWWRMSLLSKMDTDLGILIIIFERKAVLKIIFSCPDSP